jgi:acetolactate synthase I/II/III large subunit
MTVQRLVSQEATAGEVVARVLADAGIDMVFGISGGHTGRIFAGLEKQQNAVRTVLVREESLGGVMAEVYGRLKRLPGVLIGQGPWVLGNGLLGTLEAHLSSSPMLLLTDFSDPPNLALHAPYQSGAGDYGAWDARRAFGGVTKQVFQALDPSQAVQATQLAIKHAMSGQMGPVAVIFSFAALNGRVGPETVPPLYPTQLYMPPPAVGADTERVARAAAALRSAKRPVIIAGNGVRMAQAYGELTVLAEAQGIPVATSASGKGTFAETHDLALGVYGTFGTATANAIIGEADLVLVIGSKLGASDTARENTDLLDPTRQTFIQIDIEQKNASWTFPAEHVLVGDAAIVLEQLREAIGEDAGRRKAGMARVAEQRRQTGYFDQPAYAASGSPVHPQRIIGELMRNLPADAIVTCDAGENRILMTHLYQTQREEGFLQAAGSGPMGFAIPAALGAKLVHPSRTVVAVCGDGGFAMSMNGLMTAIEEDIPIVVVIFNNKALGWVLHGGSGFAAKFKDFDFAGIARAMGCHAERVSDPNALGAAIKTAIAARGPAVIDVDTSLNDITFADITSPLAKVKAAARR